MLNMICVWCWVRPADAAQPLLKGKRGCRKNYFVEAEKQSWGRRVGGTRPTRSNPLIGVGREAECPNSQTFLERRWRLCLSPERRVGARGLHESAPRRCRPCPRTRRRLMHAANRIPHGVVTRETTPQSPTESTASIVRPGGCTVTQEVRLRAALIAGCLRSSSRGPLKHAINNLTESDD